MEPEIDPNENVNNPNPEDTGAGAGAGEDQLKAKKIVTQEDLQGINERIGRLAEGIDAITDKLNTKPNQEDDRLERNPNIDNTPEEVKERYEKQFDMPYDEIVKQGMLFNSFIQPFMLKQEETFLSFEKKDLRSSDKYFTALEKEVDDRYSKLPMNQKGRESYLNLVTKVKAEKMDEIINREVESRMSGNAPSYNTPGSSPNNPTVKTESGPYSLSDEQKRVSLKYGIKPEDAEKSLKEDMEEIEREKNRERRI